MKIEIGSGSKVLGTKKVSAKGQISGLTEYAGEEVMIVLVKDEPSDPASKFPHEVFLEEIQTMVEQQMERAFKEYKKLGDTFKTPNDAAKEFIKRMSADILADRIMKDMNKWLENIVPEIRKDDEDKL